MPAAVVQLARAMAEGLARAGQRDAGGAAAREPVDDRPPLVEVAEAARLLGVSRMTVTRLCDEGHLPCVVVARGGRQKLRRVPRAFVDEAVAAALAGGGELDLAEFASQWRGRHAAAGPVGRESAREAVAGGAA